MRMADDFLMHQLQAFAPRSILAVGESAGALVSGYSTRHPDCEVVHVGSREAVAMFVSTPATQRYDFGLTAGYLETVDKETGGVLIARLRDVQVKRLCVVVPDAEVPQKDNWTDAELTAFGLSFLERLQQGNVAYRIYGFDICSYKKTPGWLNPRHWANPERWNKDRW